jgi:hypothetical protein
MHHRLSFAVHPGSGKREIRPVALLETQNILIELNRFGEFPGPNVEMIEQAYAHVMPPWRDFDGPLAQIAGRPTNGEVALHNAGFMVRVPAP